MRSARNAICLFIKSAPARRCRAAPRHNAAFVRGAPRVRVTARTRSQRCGAALKIARSDAPPRYADDARQQVMTMRARAARGKRKTMACRAAVRASRDLMPSFDLFSDFHHLPLFLHFLDFRHYFRCLLRL